MRRKWDQVDIPAFAAAWLHERRNGGRDSDDSHSMNMTLLSFTASPSVQWDFICAAVEQSKDDDELGEIAAGPFEHLMGTNGDEFIEKLERECGANPKFARMTTGAWQHTMDDQIWARVQAIQERASPLGE